MSGCSKCNKHSCGCKPSLDIWTRPLSLERDNSCEPDPCKTSDPCDAPVDITGCNFSWSITPLQTTAGGPANFRGVNLPPNITFQVRVTGNNNNTDYYWTINSDSAGVANAVMNMPRLQGSYQFTPIVNRCNALPKRNSIEVVIGNSGEIAPTPCTCDGAVIIKPVFVDTIIYSGTRIALTLVITNTNSCAVTELTMPILALPTGLAAVDLAGIKITNLTVPGNSSVTETFLVDVTNNTAGDIQAGVVVPASTSNYRCKGSLYFTGGGSAYATIKSLATGNCALVIENFSVLPSVIANTVSATYSLTIKNTGTNPLTNLAFGPISLLGANVAMLPNITLGVSAVSLAAGTSQTYTATGVFTKSGPALGVPFAHQVTIPSGAITATCSFGQISNQQPSTAVLIITD